jgi:hypothetical protein
VNIYAPLVPVFVVAVLAPLLAGLMPVRSRLPQVVLLLLGGVVIGPALVGAGVLSVILLPMVAGRLPAHAGAQPAEKGPR